MQTTLTRVKFLDHPFAVEDLQALAEMLTTWFRQQYRQNATLHITTTLWGFPKQDGAALVETVREIAGAQNLPFDSVALSGADFLVIENAPLPSSVESANEAVLGAGTVASLRLLETGPFENFWCEIALSFVHSGAQIDQNTRRVTLAGVVRQNQFILKTLWPGGAGELHETAFANAAWPHEANLLVCLDAYRTRTPLQPHGTAAAVFPDPSRRAASTLLSWFLQPNPGGSVRPIVLRLMAALGIIGICVLFMVLVSPHFAPLGYLGIVPAALGFCHLVRAKVRLIVRARRMMREANRTLYARPVYHRETDLSRTPHALINPALIKYSREIEAMGGQHFKDIICNPPVNGDFSIRVFLLPDYDTLFCVSLMNNYGLFTMFPAKPGYLVRTNLSGKRLSSINTGGGYRRQLDSSCISRLFPGVTAPDEMLKKHLVALRQAEASGLHRLPLEPDRILSQMDKEHIQCGELEKKYGYFHWGDAIRMVFDIPRKEYLLQDDAQHQVMVGKGR